MNKRGHPATLVPSHPGNRNALKHGAYSKRFLNARAREIESELAIPVELPPADRLALRETCGWMAIIEAIDNDLDERGLVNKAGDVRSLLTYRARATRHLDQWLTKLTRAVDRLTSDGEDRRRLQQSDYLREVERIAMGADAAASSRDRLAALKILLASAAPGDAIPKTVTVMFVGEKLSPMIPGELSEEHQTRLDELCEQFDALVTDAQAAAEHAVS